jgi:hypothetical protein
MNTESKIALCARALKVGHVCLTFKKSKSGWAAYVPARQDRTGYPQEISDVKLCDWCPTLKRLRFTVASRYLAQVYENSKVCHINLRWAMKLPNWCGPYGALNELAPAMKRAGLI